MTLQHLTEADLKQLIQNRDRDAITVQGGLVTALPRVRRVAGPARERLAPAPFHAFTLALTGQLISGKNRVHIRRDGHHYPEQAFVKWRTQALMQILEQFRTPLGLRCSTITAPVCLTCDYWPGDHRTRDVSGQLDALFHLLVYAKVLKDDGLIYNVLWRRYAVNAKFPKIIMEFAPWPT